MSSGLKSAMDALALQPNVIFMGQSVAAGGTRMSPAFADVPEQQLLEMPVAEDLQVGIGIGLSLEGFLPVSAFPRWNFLLCAANQLINHLDRLPLYSQYEPKMIIRVAVGHHKPLDPGPQHQDDFSDAFAAMFKTVTVVKTTEEAALDDYLAAAARRYSTIVVEGASC